MLPTVVSKVKSFEVFITRLLFDPISKTGCCCFERSMGKIGGDFSLQTVSSKRRPHYTPLNALILV
jgi:hypothetical protein